MDLFSGPDDKRHEPLAARMRPRTLDEYVGQDHIVGPGRLLRRAIQADQLSSVIFYGPPGTGKTTLARVIANHTKSNFVTLNAVLAGVQQIRDSIAAAEEQRKLYGRRTILFVDEVHRWNRAQQDALLPWVESGTIILIGATTENPFFEVNKALVSRSRVFQLKALEAADLERAARAALADRERGYGKWRVEFAPGALEHLVDTASGDARSLLNALELAVETSVPSWPPDEGTRILIDLESAEESIQRKVVLYDRDGDYHYDVISAFIKSLRGRDPDAALYWLARMVAAGEDPGFIFRRMLISACEDTGLAAPEAVSIVESCAAAFDRVGLPEGRYHLAHAALYLATAPKSNSSLAFFDALASVEKEDAEVPNHLRDDNRDAEGFGHGDGYLYPHTYRDHWVAQQYLPDPLVGRVFYTPTSQGYEGTIKDEILTRRELQIADLLDEAAEAADRPRGEILTFSPGGRVRDSWTRRLDSGKTETLLAIRSGIMNLARVARHHRVLVFGADDGLLLWEAGRLAPEGFVAGLCRTEKARAVLEQYASTLDPLDRPALNLLAPGAAGDIPFDLVIARDPAMTVDGIVAFAKERAGGLASDGAIVFSVRVPREGTRLSRVLETEPPAAFAAAETSFFENNADPMFAWGPDDLARALEAGGWSCAHTASALPEPRRVLDQDIDRWFDPSSPYGHAISAIGAEAVDAAVAALRARARMGPIVWDQTIAFFRIERAGK
jgi:putative ATPase